MSNDETTNELLKKFLDKIDGDMYGRDGQPGQLEKTRRIAVDVETHKYEHEKTFNPVIEDYKQKKIFFQGAIWVVSILLTTLSLFIAWQSAHTNDAIKELHNVASEIKKAVQ